MEITPTINATGSLQIVQVIKVVKIQNEGHGVNGPGKFILFT